MKRLILVFGLVLGAGLFAAPPLIGNEALAIAGCCKERATAKHPWKQNGLSLRRCKEQNKKRDKGRDSVFDRAGLVWWDMRC
ncbi:MAG: hypothetical protein V3T80_01305 [Kiloniellales bacterium]|jgi:hypothetical protein